MKHNSIWSDIWALIKACFRLLCVAAGAFSLILGAINDNSTMAVLGAFLLLSDDISELKKRSQ